MVTIGVEATNVAAAEADLTSVAAVEDEVATSDHLLKSIDDQSLGITGTDHHHRT